ncbi:DUF4003 family protein [Sediminibacillus albus]|uniref:DUF4003 domain-containing protein n=1 Tax=Sediminibacillus albus TaxID=407036 RepID=A0A1G9B4H0_9BACI|nr:DUF4003 family protein [Sediminibacillus albus]SDK34388.1 Protein of unknown function [Sediminibacillus albus]
MYTEELQQKTDAYVDIYQQLKTNLKWKVSDQRIFMIAASLYIVNNQNFCFKRFSRLANLIKKESGLFSSLKSHSRFTTAAMLDVQFSHPEDKFQEMIDIYKQMVEFGFRRGAFTYIAALVLLTNEESDYTARINKADVIYQSMKDEHIFLTSTSDYPLAALLAQRNGIVSELTSRIEACYSLLDKNGFRKGNDLQFLSHILALDEEEEIAHLVERTASVSQQFDQAGIKRKTKFYPLMGMLALLPEQSIDLQAIAAVIDRLNKQKLFKWQKDMNVIMAVNFYMSDKIADSSVLNTSLSTSMETIIQAQQAAMIAAVTGASAAAASSSN